MSRSMNNYPLKLALSEAQHARLQKHLFPGDGLEAAAIMLCAQSAAHRYVVNQILLVDHSDCRIRSDDRICWPGTAIEEAIDLAESQNLSILLMHSHPGGLFAFSDVDNESDQQTVAALFEATELDSTLHGSAIMTPDGAIRARLYNRQLVATELSEIHCASDELRIWQVAEKDKLQPTPMAFSSQMSHSLKRLSACVVGASVLAQS